MTAIAGSAATDTAHATTDAAHVAADAPVPGAPLIDLSDAAPSTPAAASTEERIAEALLVCMGRWGLAKTTMDDVAREAGISRATVYRLFPGGKAAIMRAAVTAEVLHLVGLLREELADCEDLEQSIVRAIHLAASFLSAHEALTFLREHDPVAFERLLTFDQLELVFATAGPLLAPVLAPHCVDDEHARTAAVWATRLVVSHVANPSPSFDLTDERDVHRLVHTFVMPGLRPEGQPD
jgi:AcrR family transcriptional regulator